MSWSESREKNGHEASPSCGGPCGFDAGKKIKGQAPYPHRHARQSRWPCCARSRYSRSRRRATRAGVNPVALSLAAAHLHRRRLGGRQIARRVEGQRRMDVGDRQEFISRRGLRSSATPMGRRPHIRFGSVAAAASLRISRPPSQAPSDGWSSTTSEPSPGGSQRLDRRADHFESGS